MVKTFKVPWAAWREPEYLELTFPDSWNASLYRMNAAENSKFSSEEIKQRVLNPIGTPKLSELAQGKEKVVIVVDDMKGHPAKVSLVSDLPLTLALDDEVWTCSTGSGYEIHDIILDGKPAHPNRMLEHITPLIEATYRQ